MIELQSVTKEYVTGETVIGALRDVSLEISRGEYISILGPSGSGKSTLLHLIGCLDTPTRGSYLLDAEEVSGLDPNRLADVRSRRFGFIFQAFHLMPRSTALENVALPMRYTGVGAADGRQRAAQLLARVGLPDRLHHRPSELSGGQQQRVAIARALANRPDVILADEPTGNLDSTFGTEVIELLEQLNAEGQAVIMVTHDEHLAARTRRTIRMLDGRVVADGLPAQRIEERS